MRALGSKHRDVFSPIMLSKCITLLAAKNRNLHVFFKAKKCLRPFLLSTYSRSRVEHDTCYVLRLFTYKEEL